jgi:hypothetical protein
MSLRILLSSLFSFLLGGVFFTTALLAVNLVARDASIARQDSRAPDRDAIRVHIDKIFKVYIDGYELDFNGQKNTQSGSATEIFVRRKGTGSITDGISIPGNSAPNAEG